MKIVSIDASVAASWLFQSQRTASADAFAKESFSRRFVAPGIFAWEIGNQIAIRARGDKREAARLISVLESFEIQIALQPEPEAVFGYIGQAMQRNLTLFDTAYLNQALTLGASLASRDRRLLEAAIAIGVDVHDLRG